MLTAWKEREPLYRRRRAAIAAENNGVVPAFATAGAAVDVAPTARARRRDRLTAPDDPEMQVSREEFDELVRDLHVDEPPRPRARWRHGDEAEGGPADAEAEAPRARSGRGLVPEDVVMPDRSESVAKPKRSAAAKQRGKHGQAALMGALAWTMMGLALWHFTIFLPDRCWAGIIGAFLGSVFGALIFGFAINGFTVPGQDETNILTVLEASPARSSASACSTGSAPVARIAKRPASPACRPSSSPARPSGPLSLRCAREPRGGPHRSRSRRSRRRRSRAWIRAPAA